MFPRNLLYSSHRIVPPLLSVGISFISFSESFQLVSPWTVNNVCFEKLSMICLFSKRSALTIISCNWCHLINSLVVFIGIAPESLDRPYWCKRIWWGQREMAEEQVSVFKVEGKTKPNKISQQMLKSRFLQKTSS